MNFSEASLKEPVQQVVQITDDNIAELAENLNGTLEDGILKFQLSSHQHLAIAGDWLVLFSGGIDALVFTDKMYKRIYNTL